MFDCKISPSEAVAQYIQGTRPYAQIGHDIADAYMAVHDHDFDNADLDDMYGCIWYAGWMHGICEARMSDSETQLSADLHQRPIGRLPIGGGRTLPVYKGNHGYLDTIEGNKLFAAYLRALHAYEAGKRAFDAAQTPPGNPAAGAERREPHHRRRRRRRPRGRRYNKPAGGCPSRSELSGGRNPRNPGPTCQRSA